MELIKMQKTSPEADIKAKLTATNLVLTLHDDNILPLPYAN